MNCRSIQSQFIKDNLQDDKKKDIFIGKLQYSVRPEYLPNFLINEPNSINSIKYKVNILYEPTDPSDLFVLFNPLVILGFPIQRHFVKAHGDLIVNNNQTYSCSTVTITEFRTLYHNPNYSEMRSIALTKLKLNFEKCFDFNKLEVNIK